VDRHAGIDRPESAIDGAGGGSRARDPDKARVTRSSRRAAAGWLVFMLLIGPWPAVVAPVPAHAVTATAVAQSTEPGALIPRQQVVRRTLRSDTTEQYLLYIPSRGGAGAPLFVTAHGVSRNVEEHATLFAPFAERQGVVLVAPFFDEARHGDYQRMGRKGRGPRSDQVLDSILSEVRSLTGAQAGKFWIFGFSGGAQFAHRYAMAHPDRIAHAVIGSAGWYTFPDSATPYPYGTGPSGVMEGLRFDPDAFLRVPMTVLVGGADTGTTNLRQNDQVNRQQGLTRRARAWNWTAAMRRAALARGQAPVVTCEEVPGIPHNFGKFMAQGGLGDKVFRAMFGPVASAAPRPPEPATASHGAGSR
jgi:poly(3-hydroxybutyrate) depolymerase